MAISELKNIKKVHFIGIGGAGMSGLAKVLKQKGLQVSGSDIKESSTCAYLKDLGIEIFIGHDKKNVGKVDAVVISSAISKENVELAEAKKKKITVYQRAEMLALVASKKRVIAISGTHGKTTTTSLVSVLFEMNNLDPTFLVGGELNDTGSNAKYGQSKYFIAETDESDGSLLNFDPDVLVITNIEADHLDYFGFFEKIMDLFTTFISKIKPDGTLIVYGDHPNIKTVMRASKATGDSPYGQFDERDCPQKATSHSKLITYGANSNNDIYFDNFNQEALGSSFNVYHKGKKLGKLKLKVPGEHNALNALAAVAVGFSEGLDFNQIKTALESFSGVKRRFQLIDQNENTSVYDDYAHHPTEIKATLKAAAAAKKGRVVCVFQPHRYSRTNFLAQGFGQSFTEADMVIITDIYSAGEAAIEGVSAKLIVDSIIENEGHKNLAYIPKLDDVVEYLQQMIRPGDMIITMGAGDVSTVGQKLLA